jgi:hypothetical protein
MKRLSLLIYARMTEVTTIGQITIDSYLRDIAYFTAFKPSKYTALFLTNLMIKHDAVKDLVNPGILTAQIKVITLRMKTGLNGLREPLNFLEGYLTDAEGLTMNANDFGIKGVRKKINSGDIEGLNWALNLLVTNITNNMSALTDVGYSNDSLTALKASQQSIFEDNIAQNKKEMERAALVVHNLNVMNDYLKDIKGIWADGKRLFKFKNKVKLKDYTNSDILKNIRQDERHTLIKGTVYNKNGKAVSGAKVMARRAVNGKRGKTAVSNRKGIYELKGLIPQSYTITVILKSGTVFTATAAAVTNEAVRMDLREEESS